MKHFKKTVTCRACLKTTHIHDPVTKRGQKEFFEQPFEGAVHLCLFCAAISIYDEQLNLRKPTDAELQDMLANVEFRELYISVSTAVHKAQIEFGKHN